MQVNGTVRFPSDSYTRPANATQYAVKDAISDVAGATATKLIFHPSASSPGGAAYLKGARLYSSFNQATTLQARLHLYRAVPTTANNDNDKWSPTDAESLTEVCTVDFNLAWVVQNDGAGTAGNAYQYVAVDRYVRTGTLVGYSAGMLWGILEALNTYTPGSGEVITVELEVEH